MSLLDLIREIFGYGKKNANLITSDLVKIYGENDQLEAALYANNIPLADKNIRFNVNGKNYDRKTDGDGIARLNINLPVGEYDTHITFNDPEYTHVKTFANVIVHPKITTDDLNMVEKDGSRYTAIVEDAKGNKLNGVKVYFKVNGRTYERPSENGVAGLNINLKAGDYTITTSCLDVVKNNTIHITKSSPAPEGNHFGYWIFGKDMLNVNLQNFKDCGVTDLFLNYYAITTHGESRVVDWINQANNFGLRVHMWMQCFYDGEWHNPKDMDLSGKIAEAKKYAGMNGVYGVHLDYLRYPGNAYKTDGATEAVNQFAMKVREAIGNKFLSCAIMPESENEYYYGQDAGALGRICDVVIPMQYKGNYDAGASWLASTSRMFSQMANIWSGLQSYKSDDDPTILSETELKNDVDTCIRNGAKGAILFRYGLSPNVPFPTPTPGEKKSTRMEGTDINMTYKDGTQYQCAVYDDNGRVAGTVNLTINGKTYPRTPDNTGLYKLNLNLPAGNYTINANYLGDNTHLPSSVTNNITINKQKQEPTQLWDYFTQQGGGYLGQKTGYTCGPHSLMQCIHRLTGEDVSEMTLASVCGTTSEGTDHDGLATGLAWFNREYGYNLKMEWKNFSEVGFEGTQQLIDNGACFHHIYYRLYAGHYEVPKWTGWDPIYVLNSLGDQCGDGYCGYIEERSRSTHQAYINGISQKSVCIITR